MNYLLVLVLLMVIRISQQTLYSCDSSVTCGCSSNAAAVNRIAGGEASANGTWGWAVSLSIRGNDRCGGSIISSSWILTAARCVSDVSASQVTVSAGSTKVWMGTQTRDTSRIVVHPGYNSDSNLYDIALLQLATPLVMNDPNVAAICLPSVNLGMLAAGEWPPANTSVVAVGWGRLSETVSTSAMLQQVTLQTVAYNAPTCSEAMEDWHVQFCAGVSGGGKGTCQDDLGGPLMMFGANRRWMLVGVISNGIGCAQSDYSGLYTRVAFFQDWIKSSTNSSIWVGSESGSGNSTTPTMSGGQSTTTMTATPMNGQTTTTMTTPPMNGQSTTTMTGPPMNGQTTTTMTTSPMNGQSTTTMTDPPMASESTTSMPNSPSVDPYTPTRTMPSIGSHATTGATAMLQLVYFGLLSSFMMKLF